MLHHEMTFVVITGKTGRDGVVDNTDQSETTVDGFTVTKCVGLSSNAKTRDKGRIH